jgi:hypothetical protein
MNSCAGSERCIAEAAIYLEGGRRADLIGRAVEG